MKNPSMVHRAENMWCMFAPYRHVIKEDCPAKVKLALLVNKWMNPWHAMQDLEKVFSPRARRCFQDLGDAMARRGGS